MKKKIITILMILILIAPIFILTGCSSGKVSIFITNRPNKIAYEVGEEFVRDGLSVESLNTDGTTTRVCIKDEDIIGADTSTSGEKVVTVKSGDASTVFNIYVADIIISPQDNVREKLLTANDGDVVYFKNGEYKNDDGKLNDIIVDKSIFIVGESKDKTVFKGNFLVGAKLVNSNYEKIDNFSDVKIVNMCFKQEYKLEGNKINYSSKIEKDVNGAINGFSTENLYVTNCNFANYSYGVLMDNANNLSVTRNSFKNLLISGIKVKENCEKVSIFKNSFVDIGKNVLINENESQGFLSCINLGFNKKGNAGIIISQNTFNRTAQKDGNWIYYDNQSQLIKDKDDLTKLGYVNNSAIIILHSNSENNLQVSGIIMSANNYGVTLQNVRLGLRDNDSVNQSGIIINENF